MKTLFKTIVVLFLAQAVESVFSSATCRAAVVVDHKCTDIYVVPTNRITQAKHQLHILYGHRSHGGQITDGMVALQSFMDDKGYPPGLFAWTWDQNTYPNPLDLRNHPFTNAMTLGYPNFTDWEQATRSYLSTNPEINVVMWSWSYELASATKSNVDVYLGLMDGLRRDYTNITFIYMTAPLDGKGVDGNCNLRNDQIRSHCLAQQAALYDFGDIESYDTDGLTNFMTMRTDDECWYVRTETGIRDRNWAMDWQTNHQLGVDWFAFSAAHTQPLNGDLKTYAAWWLWARLAGWPGIYSFKQWQRDRFTADELSDPALEASVWGEWANPDGDRLANIYEYALGTNPKLSENAPMVQSAGYSGRHFAFSYQRTSNTEGVTFDVQRSLDLVSWSAVPPASFRELIEPITNALEKVTLEFLDSQLQQPAFYRLNLTAQ